MELRRVTSSTWEGTDAWRAREDHTLIAMNSKVKLEERIPPFHGNTTPRPPDQF